MGALGWALPQVESWNSDHVFAFMKEADFEAWAQAFRNHHINGRALLALDRAALADLGMAAPEVQSDFLAAVLKARDTGHRATNIRTWDNQEVRLLPVGYLHLLLEWVGYDGNGRCGLEAKALFPLATNGGGLGGWGGQLLRHLEIENVSSHAVLALEQANISIADFLRLDSRQLSELGISVRRVCARSPCVLGLLGFHCFHHALPRSNCLVAVTDGRTKTIRMISSSLLSSSGSVKRNTTAS
jgi:hypothetical protein